MHVRRRPAPGWVLARFECDDVDGGRMIESGRSGTQPARSLRAAANSGCCSSPAERRCSVFVRIVVAGATTMQTEGVPSTHQGPRPLPVVDLDRRARDGLGGRRRRGTAASSRAGPGRARRWRGKCWVMSPIRAQHPVHHLGGEGAGGDAVDVDVEARPLDGEHLGHAVDRRLGDRVQRGAVAAVVERADRRDVDDAARLLRPRAGRGRPRWRAATARAGSCRARRRSARATSCGPAGRRGCRRC